MYYILGTMYCVLCTACRVYVYKHICSYYVLHEFVDGMKQSRVRRQETGGFKGIAQGRQNRTDGTTVAGLC